MARERKGIYNDCAYCGKNHYVFPCHIKKVMCCSTSCGNKIRAHREIRSIVCEKCGVKFESKHDHGKFPRFCSKDCFLSGAIIPKHKDCINCGIVFMAVRSRHTSDGLKDFCSHECLLEHRGNLVEKNCANCGNVFSVNQSRKDSLCCSFDCKNEYYTGTLSSAWKGGEYVDSTSGQIRVYLGMKDKISQYMAQHRIVASRIIGRRLFRDEVIIHINGDNQDNRPENLFICSNSDMRRYYAGSLKSPSEGNLYDYTARMKQLAPIAG